jgi:hypothetical protein
MKRRRRETEMTALLMSSDDHGNLGGRLPPRGGSDQRRGKDFEASSRDAAVPPAAAERSKSWVARFIEAMTKPVEGNYDNP